MKIYQTNNRFDNQSFKNVAIVSFAGISCNIWDFILNNISKNIDETLFIHLITNDNGLKLNDKSELIDFYRLMGVKHLVIDNVDMPSYIENNIINKWYLNLFNKAVNIWLDGFLYDLFSKAFAGYKFKSLASFKEETGIIADYIQEGRIEEACLDLGYLYQLRGKVVHGNRLGRELGYPTANLLPDDCHKLIPAQGVYAAFVNVNKKWYKSMVNIGKRPTFEEVKLTIEAHLFDFGENIYNQNIAIHFMKKIRDEKKFNNFQALKNQLVEDKQLVLSGIEKTEKAISINNNFCFVLK